MLTVPALLATSESASRLLLRLPPHPDSLDGPLHKDFKTHRNKANAYGVIVQELLFSPLWASESVG
jgi:hypothetical protein